MRQSLPSNFSSNSGSVPPQRKPNVSLSAWSDNVSTIQRLKETTPTKEKTPPVRLYPRPTSLDAVGIGSTQNLKPFNEPSKISVRPPSLISPTTPDGKQTSDDSKKDPAREIIIEQSKKGHRPCSIDYSDMLDVIMKGEIVPSPRDTVKDMVAKLPVHTLSAPNPVGQYDRGRRPSHGAQREDVLKFEQQRIKALQEERLHIQKKTFTKWMNSFLQKARMEVEDLFTDLADGKKLLKLLEIISGEKLGKPNNGKMRVHKVENLNKSLAFLQTKKVRLESIGAEDIVDGNPRLILGLIWTIILRFQIQEIEIDVDEDNDSSEKRSAKDALLLWCQRKTNGYTGVAIHDFTGSWRSGLGFNALIHAHRPDLVKFETLVPSKHIDNLNNAFDVAHNELGIPKLLDAEDVDTARPDEKSILTYVASYYHTFARMKNEIKSGRRIANIIAQMMDADRKKDLYERLTTDLLNWIRQKVIELEDRNLTNSLEGIQQELLRFKQYRTMEKPPKYKERSEIEALYFHVNTLLKALNQPLFTPSEGRLLSELQRAWETLESAEHRREVALREELMRQEKLEQLHYKFMRKSVLREGYVKEMIQVLSDTHYLSDLLHHVDATVKKHEAIGVDIMARKERFTDLRAMSAELSQENYHGAEKVKQRETEIMKKWDELLALFEKLKKSLGTQNNLMAALRDIDTLTGTIQELQGNFQSQGVGEHLLAVEDLLQKHALQELQVTACGDTLARLRKHGQNFGQASILLEKLENLDKEYARLMQSSEDRRVRLEDARNLFQFVQDHEEEESWLIEKQRICTAAITAKDLRAVLSLQQKHKALQDEMKARKPKSDQLRQVGQRLIDDKHPRSLDIKSRLESLQERWNELVNLVAARKKQLEDEAEAYQFYSDANETESWLKEKMALANSTDYGVDEPSAQALLGRLKAQNEEINAYKGDIQSLNETAAKLIETGISNLELAAVEQTEPEEVEEWKTETRLVPQEVWEEEPFEHTEMRITYEMRVIPQVKSLYPFNGQGMEMTKGEIMFLINKTNQDWWNVKKPSGVEGFVPANYVKEIEPKTLSVPVQREEKVRELRKVKKTKMVRQTVKVNKPVVPKPRPSRVANGVEAGQTIEQRQKKINASYEELLKLTEKRRLLLEDAIRLFGFYKECDDFERWIKDKEKLLRSDDSSENVEAAKRKYENFLTDLSASGRRIDAIDQVVNEFRTQGHSQLDKVVARQKQIHALWQRLNQLKAEKERNLEGASSVQVFNRTCDEARDWMTEKMQQLDGAEHGPDLKTVQALQRRHLNLERELAPVEEKVNRVNLLAESVKTAYPNERNNVVVRQAEVSSLWQNVKDKALERRSRLEDAVGQQVFVNSAKNLLNWAQVTKDAIISRPAVRDIATAEALQKAHGEIIDDIQAHEDEWQEVIDLGDTLYKRNPQSENIKSTLVEMVETHDELVKLSQEQDNWLQQCRDLQCLNREADQIDASSSAHEAVLNHSDLGRSLDDVKALQKRHEDLEKTLTAQDERVAVFCDKADEMIRKHHYDSQNIDKRRNQVLMRRRSVKELADKRRESLLAASRFQELAAKVHDLQDWVAEKMKIASDESYRDLNNLERKLQKHEAFERELKANEQQLRLLNKSPLVNSGEYRSEDVSQMLTDLNEGWTTLVALSRDKGRRLRQAAAEHAYNRTLEDARDKVEELRLALSSTQTGSDQRDCKYLLKKHQLLEQELSTWKVKIEDLVAEGNAMANDGHFDSEAIIKAGKLCQKKFEELSEPAKIRRSLLEESMRYHKFHFELDTELQWVREHKPLTEMSALGQNLYQAQALQKKHKKLEAEIAGHQPMINKTLASGNQLITENHPQTKDIERLLALLESEWNDLGKSAQERGKKLELSLKAQQFFFDSEEVESWLTEKQDVLNSTDNGRDRDASIKFLAKHKALELELDSYNGIITEMQHVAEKMVSNKHPDAKAISARQQALSHQMRQLQKSATARQTQLMESLYRHEYFLASAELEQWIKEQMITATSEDYGQDYEHLLLLQSKFNDWKSRKEVETKRFNQCKELAEKLITDGANPYAEDVERRQEQLGAAWQNLLDEMRLREQRLNAAGEIHRFHRDVADALSRIQEKEAALSDDTGRDLNSVLALIKRHEGFENDLVVLEAQLQVLIEDGTRIQNQFPGQNSAQIAAQQENVVKQWTALQKRTTQRQDALNASYNLHKFLSQARDLMTWSVGLRTSMTAEEKISDAGSAQTVKTEHEAVKAEIEAREENFERVLELAQQLTEEDPSPNIKQKVKEELDKLLEERQLLHSAWHQKKIRLDQLIDLHFFLREAKQIMTTTSEQETVLSADDIAGLDVDEVSNAVKKHEAFEKLLNTQEERVHGLQEHGAKLLEQNHFESPLIKEQLAQVVKRRARLFELCHLRRRKLAESLLHAQFVRDAAEASAWVNERQKRLDAEVSNGEEMTSLEEKIKKLQKHQAFQAELVAHEPRINGIKEQLNRLVSEHHAEANSAKVQWSTLNASWMNLLDDANSYSRGLEEAQDILEFHNQVDKIEAWIREKEVMVHAGEAGKDYEHCVALQRKLDDVDSDMRVDDQRIKNIYNLADKLIKQGRTDTDLVKKKRDHLANKWQGLQGALSHYREHLAGALEVHGFIRDVDDTASRVAEKSTVLLSNDLGHDLIAAERLQRRQETFERDMTAIEGKIKEHEATDRVLTKRHPESAPVITEKLTNLQGNWKKLLGLSETRRQTLRDVYKKHKIQADLRDLELWVDDTVGRMKNQVLPVSMADIKASMQLHDERKAEIGGRKEIFKVLRENGDEDDRKKLNELEVRLEKTWNERRQALERALDLAEFRGKCDQAESWLSSKEAFVNNDDCGDSTATVEVFLQKHDAFEKTLAAQINQIDDLVACAQQLSTQPEDGLQNDYNQVIAERLRLVTVRRDRLIAVSQARRIKLLDTRKWCVFLRNVYEVQNWLLRVLELATDENYRDSSNLKNKIQKHSTFKTEIEVNKPRVDAVITEGQKLKDEGHFQSNEISHEIDALKRLWNELAIATEDKQQKLNDAYEGMVFLRSLEAIEDWMNEIEGILSSDDHGRDLTGVSHLLRKHTNLEKDMIEKGEEVNRLKGILTKFRSSNRFMLEEIDDKFNTALKKFNSLEKPIQIRRENLEDSLQLHQFMGDVDEELQWLDDKEPAFSSEDLGTSLTSVQNLQKKHQVLESELQTRGPVITALESRAAHMTRNKHFASSNIDAKTRELRKRFDRANDLVSVRRLRLLDAVESQTFYAEAIDAVAWMKDKRPPLSSHYLGKDEDSADGLLKRLQNSKRDLDAFHSTIQRLQTLSTGLIERGHFDSENIQKKQKELELFYEELVQLALTRQQKLNDSRQYFSFLREGEEITEWIHENTALASSEDYGTDAEHVDILIKTFDAFVASVNGTENRVKDWISKGKTLINENNHEADNIRIKIKEIKSLWDFLKELAHARQEALNGAKEVHMFDRTAEETIEWVGEKQAALSYGDGFEQDLETIQALMRKHEVIESELVAVESQVNSVQDEAKRLLERFPETADHVEETRESVTYQWHSLLNSASTRRNQLIQSEQLQAYFDQYRDLMSWLNEILAKITAPDLAQDVVGAENLILRHKEHTSEIGARADELQKFFDSGELLISGGHFLADEIRDKINALQLRHKLVLDTWDQRMELYKQNLDTQIFKRDADLLESWLVSREPILRDRQVGSSIGQVEELLRKHDDFEKTIAAQEEKCLALKRITLLEQSFKLQQEKEVAAKQAERERLDREKIEARKRKEVQRITDERRKEDERRKQVDGRPLAVNGNESPELKSPNRLEVPGSPQLQKSGSLSQIIVNDRMRREMKRAESMKVDPKRPRRTPSFTARRRTQSFRKLAKLDQLPPLEIEGVLDRKQELQNGGKRAPVRSWKTFYTVLCGQLLCFFKDVEDFSNSKAASSPISILKARCEKADDYTKRKYVFRITCTDGSEYLFLANTADEMSDWIKKIKFHADLPPSLQLLSYDESQKKSEHDETMTSVGDVSSGGSSRASTPEPSSPGLQKKPHQTQAQFLASHRPPIPPRSAPPAVPTRRSIESVDVRDGATHENGSQTWRHTIDATPEMGVVKRSPMSAPPLPISQPPLPPPAVMSRGGGPHNPAFAPNSASLYSHTHPHHPQYASLPPSIPSTNHHPYHFHQHQHTTATNHNNSTNSLQRHESYHQQWTDAYYNQSYGNLPPPIADEQRSPSVASSVDRRASESSSESDLPPVVRTDSTRDKQSTKSVFSNLFHRKRKGSNV